MSAAPPSTCQCLARVCNSANYTYLLSQLCASTLLWSVAHSERMHQPSLKLLDTWLPEKSWL